MLSGNIHCIQSWLEAKVFICPTWPTPVNCRLDSGQRQLLRGRASASWSKAHDSIPTKLGASTGWVSKKQHIHDFFSNSTQTILSPWHLSGCFKTAISWKAIHIIITIYLPLTSRNVLLTFETEKWNATFLGFLLDTNWMIFGFHRSECSADCFTVFHHL